MTIRSTFDIKNSVNSALYFYEHDLKYFILNAINTNDAP